MPESSESPSESKIQDAVEKDAAPLPVEDIVGEEHDFVEQHESNGIEPATTDIEEAENEEVPSEEIAILNGSDFTPEVPILVGQLQGQIVEAGALAVNFSCAIKNATGIGWSFNGKPLGPDEKYDIQMGPDEITLTVKDVNSEDTGVYVCYGVNTDGRVTTVGYLSVRGK